MEIQGYSDYLIYPDGRVFNKRLNRDIAQHSTKKGYLRLNLNNWYHNNGSGTCRHQHQSGHRVHRLLALHYIPNPENKPLVDHINGITNDNRLENLRWATTEENTTNHKLQKTNTSGITGINIRNRGSKVKYVARWREGGKEKSKQFANIEEAIAHRQQKLTELGLADFQRK